MHPDASVTLWIAAICFAGAAATFLVFFGPGLAWRIRRFSRWELALGFVGAAGVAALLLHVAARLLR